MRPNPMTTDRTAPEVNLYALAESAEADLAAKADAPQFYLWALTVIALLLMIPGVMQ